MSFANDLEAAILNQLDVAGAFGGLTLTGNLFLAASTTDPTEDGSGITEPAGIDGYARQAVTLGSVVQGADQATRSNTNAPSHGPASADWGAITHFAIYDAVTGGNFLAYAALTTPRTVLTSDTLDWGAGQLVVGQT